MTELTTYSPFLYFFMLQGCSRVMTLSAALPGVCTLEVPHCLLLLFFATFLSMLLVNINQNDVSNFAFCIACSLFHKAFEDEALTTEKFLIKVQSNITRNYTTHYRALREPRTHRTAHTRDTPHHSTPPAVCGGQSSAPSHDPSTHAHHNRHCLLCYYHCY